MSHAVRNSKQHTSFEQATITSFTGGVDCKTSRPGYAAGVAGLLPRALYFPAAGNIVLVSNNGDSDTMTVTAGAVIPCSPKSITESGTTVTSVTLLY